MSNCLFLKLVSKPIKIYIAPYHFLTLLKLIPMQTAIHDNMIYL